MPVPDAAGCPAWLPFSAEGWRTHGSEWHRQLDALLNIKKYPERAFGVSSKLELGQFEARTRSY